MTALYNKYNFKIYGVTLNYPYQYRGGGTIQLTHKENYEYVARVIGDNKITSSTEYIAFNYPWLSAGVYWEWRNINSVDDDFDKITVKINGGKVGYEERKEIFDKCLEIFKRYKKN